MSETLKNTEEKKMLKSGNSKNQASNSLPMELNMFSSDEEEKSDSELENLKDYESDTDGDSNSDEETLGENCQEEEGHQV